jgi:hypothetical protein
VLQSLAQRSIELVLGFELGGEDGHWSRNLRRFMMRDADKSLDAKVVMHLGLSARALSGRLWRRLQEEAVLRSSKLGQVLDEVDG